MEYRVHGQIYYAMVCKEGASAEERFLSVDEVNALIAEYGTFGLKFRKTYWKGAWALITRTPVRDFHPPPEREGEGWQAIKERVGYSGELVMYSNGGRALLFQESAEWRKIVDFIEKRYYPLKALDHFVGIMDEEIAKGEPAVKELLACLFSAYFGVVREFPDDEYALYGLYKTACLFRSTPAKLESVMHRTQVYYETRLKKNSGDVDAVISIGRIQGILHGVDALANDVEWIQRALAIDPGSSAAHVELARKYSLQGKKKQALAEVNQAVECDPDNPDAYSVRGNLYMAFDGKKALADFRKCLELDEKDFTARWLSPCLEKSSSGDCFIATEVYGSPFSPEVQVLRCFRDDVLVRTACGRWFVAFYYRHGPNWARGLSNRTQVKKVLRMCLSALAFVIRKGRRESFCHETEN